jgi:hypothetical protein
VSEHPDRAETSNGNGTARPSLNAAVLRRRSDRDFYLRLRDAIQQNHRALQRLGR